MREFLVEVTGDARGVDRRLADGEVVLASGERVTASTPYRDGASVFLYRDVLPEVEVPGEVPVLLRDDATGLLAVDKPPFLATMPRGAHVTQTVLVRLRRALDLPDLAPVHRLDRLTSGVLLLTTRRDVRAAYQRLVQQGGVHKTYEALAPLDPTLDLPSTVENRLVKVRGRLQVEVESGQVNAVTRLELLGELRFEGARVGHYLLTPSTGRTHQLRRHLSDLGIPILGDPLYPTVREVAPDDFSTPLQLLARRVEFVDPVSGAHRAIESERRLPIR